MATKTVSAPEEPKGIDWGVWVERALLGLLIFGIGDLIATIGWAATAALLDPGGTGSVIERTPRLVRNLGFLAFCIGLGVTIFEIVIGSKKKHGHRLAWAGGVAFVGMIAAPTLRDWATAHGGEVFSALLTALGNGLVAVLKGFRS